MMKINLKKKIAFEHNLCKYSNNNYDTILIGIINDVQYFLHQK